MFINRRHASLIALTFQVYVRSAGSYVMDHPGLCWTAISPANDVPDRADCVILIGNFATLTGLCAVEAMLSKLQVSHLTFL